MMCPALQEFHMHTRQLACQTRGNRRARCSLSWNSRRFHAAKQRFEIDGGKAIEPSKVVEWALLEICELLQEIHHQLVMQNDFKDGPRIRPVTGRWHRLESTHFRPVRKVARWLAQNDHCSWASLACSQLGVPAVSDRHHMPIPSGTACPKTVLTSNYPAGRVHRMMPS